MQRLIAVRCASSALRSRRREIICSSGALLGKVLINQVVKSVEDSPDMTDSNKTMSYLVVT